MKSLLLRIFNSCILTLFVLFVLTNCGRGKKAKDRVQEVICSMSDSLPNVTMPDGVDPNSADWKGADLEVKIIFSVL